ncbi:MAG: ankyrin repeat domain-containing protein [Lactobacillales bacterium]|jgi:hypothetical protein|nr:ankyrin repeat domain-containing protein [Lactobacillales bacterium]
MKKFFFLILMLLSFSTPIYATDVTISKDDILKRLEEARKNFNPDIELKKRESEMEIAYEKYIALSPEEDPDGELKKIRTKEQEYWLKNTKTITDKMDLITAYNRRISDIGQEIMNQNNFIYAKTPAQALSLLKKAEKISPRDFEKLLNNTDVTPEIIAYYVSIGGSIDDIGDGSCPFVYTVKNMQNVTLLIEMGAITEKNCPESLPLTLVNRAYARNKKYTVDDFVLTPEPFIAYQKTNGYPFDFYTYYPGNKNKIPKNFFGSIEKKPLVLDMFLDAGFEIPYEYEDVKDALKNEVFTEKYRIYLQKKGFDFNTSPKSDRRNSYQSLFGAARDKDSLLELFKTDIRLPQSPAELWGSLYSLKLPIDVLEVLAKKGFDFSYKAPENNTLLLFALKLAKDPSNKINMDTGLIYLINHEKNINQENDIGENLIIAASMGESNPIHLHKLIRMGANPNTVDKSQNTALIYACQNGNMPKITKLLKVSALATLVHKDKYGNDALHYCLSSSTLTDKEKNTLNAVFQSAFKQKGIK